MCVVGCGWGGSGESTVVLGLGAGGGVDGAALSGPMGDSPGALKKWMCMVRAGAAMFTKLLLFVSRAAWPRRPRSYNAPPPTDRSGATLEGRVVRIGTTGTSTAGWVDFASHQSPGSRWPAS